MNNPLADLAEEKFKEVQEAYDTIMRERASGGTGGQSSGSGSYSYGRFVFVWFVRRETYDNMQADPRLQAGRKLY